MKKVALPLALVGALGMAGAAHAESSVTLYGLIDAGFGFINTSAGNAYSMMNGNLSGDRWGLKGREDLGGGLAAIFQIESGFDVGTGQFNQAGTEFNRQAYLGLRSATWGTLTVGRQYDPVVDMVQGLTADDAFGSPFTTPGDVDNNDNSARVSNAIKYVTAIVGGLQFEGMYALNGVAGHPGSGNTYSAALAYASGAFATAAGYLHAANASVTPGMLRTTWSGTTDSLFDGVISTGYQTAASLGIAHAGATYKIGDVTIGGGYSYSAFNADAQSVFRNQEHYNSGKAYVTYQVTPSMLGGVGYIYTRASGDTTATYNQVSIGATYLVSKRTDFYADAAYQHAAGTQRTASGGTATAVASIGSYGVTGNGKSQEMVVIGMRHRF